MISISKTYWEKVLPPDHPKDDCVLCKLTYGKPVIRHPMVMIDKKTGEVIHAYWTQSAYERIMATIAQQVETKRLEESARLHQRQFKISKLRFGGKVKDRYHSWAATSRPARPHETDWSSYDFSGGLK